MLYVATDTFEDTLQFHISLKQLILKDSSEKLSTVDSYHVLPD